MVYFKAFIPAYRTITPNISRPMLKRKEEGNFILMPTAHWIIDIRHRVLYYFQIKTTRVIHEKIPPTSGFGCNNEFMYSNWELCSPTYEYDPDRPPLHVSPFSSEEYNLYPALADCISPGGDTWEQIQCDICISNVCVINCLYSRETPFYSRLANQLYYSIGVSALLEAEAIRQHTG